MNRIELLLILLAALALTSVTVIVYTALRGKGADNDIIGHTKQALDTAIKAMDTLKPLLPESDLYDKIMKAATTAVGYAEQVCNIGKIIPSQRYGEAWKCTLQSLDLMGVNISQDVEKFIGVAIESSVQKLRHKTK